jgi:hypothetical protein
MQNCEVCGRSFDPLGFQVVVPELGRGFDRIDCARSARALAGPGSRIAAVPLVALAAPVAATAAVPATLAAARAPAPRLLGSTAATLGLLAAGTAAAVFLWMRVVGTDTTSYTLGHLTAPPAFGHETAEAQVAPPAAPGPAAENPPTVPTEELVTVQSPKVPVAANPAGTGQRPSPGVSGGAAKPSSRPGKATGKGHAKHGKGHYKHGEADGYHHSGHGQGNGAAAVHGHGSSGHGGGKGKSKH